MKQFHFSCDHLPCGDLFTTAHTAKEAKENFIKYIASTIEVIEDEDNDYNLDLNEVIEEH